MFYQECLNRVDPTTASGRKHAEIPNNIVPVIIVAESWIRYMRSARAKAGFIQILRSDLDQNFPAKSPTSARSTPESAQVWLGTDPVQEEQQEHWRTSPGRSVWEGLNKIGLSGNFDCLSIKHFGSTSDKHRFLYEKWYEKLQCVTPASAARIRSLYHLQMLTEPLLFIATITPEGYRLEPVILSPVKSLPKGFLSTEVWNGKGTWICWVRICQQEHTTRMARWRFETAVGTESSEIGRERFRCSHIRRFSSS